MSKTWLIAHYEYTRHVLRRRFVLVLLSVPLMVAVFIGVIILAESLDKDYRPVGYVDHSGFLAQPVQASANTGKSVAIIAYPAESEARKALDAGQIQAYYVLPADYLETNKVQLVYVKPPKDNATTEFWDFMQLNWMAGQPADVANRVATMSDSDVIVRTPDGQREFTAAPTLGQLLPMLTGLGFMLLLSFSAGYLVQVVAEEKENRTIEIAATSASPGQLIGGKVLGLAGVTLTQVAGWILFIGAAAFVGGNVFNVEFLKDAGMDWHTALILVAVLLPAYIVYAALMTAIGATVAEAQEAQQVSGLFILPSIVPFWLVALIIENPNNPIAVALTMFPLTAPVTVAIRATFEQIPLWQVGVSFAVLATCAWASVWFAGRAFRLGMLRYGKRVNLREIFARPRALEAAEARHE
jgi:ABC-2 type transport system permease protein